MAYKDKTNDIIKKQQEIRERDHPLVWLVDRLQMAVQIIDPYVDGFPILYVNQGFTEMTGYNNAEIVGCKQSFLEGKDTNKEASRRIIEAIEQGDIITIEILNYCKDGTPFWKELHFSPVYSIQKDPIAYIGTQNDITRNKFEGQEQSKNQDLKSVFKNHSDMICFINKNGIIELPDKGIAALAIPSMEEAIGYHFAGCIADADRERVLHDFYFALQGNIKQTKGSVIHRNGEEIELDIIFIPSSPNKEPDGVYAIYKDVTGSNNAEELLMNAEMLRTVSGLAGDIVHEIRHPLTSLKGFVQLLRPHLNEKKEYIAVMLSEIERIEQITAELLLLARPHVIKFEKKNLRSLLEHVHRLMYTQTLMNNIEVHLTYHTIVEHIYCEEDKLKQVFINLIKNAVDAMPAGGTIHIEVTDKTNKSLLIRVMDDGTGIPPENMNLLDQPFYTTKKKGIGLGITNCKNIINEHGGCIKFKSPESGGVTVEIGLPIYHMKKK